MAKANQKSIHPLKMLNIVRPATKKSVKEVERIRKDRRRRERRMINRQRFKAPRGFKMAKKDSHDPTKSDKQIENGFKVAKRLM